MMDQGSENDGKTFKTLKCLVVSDKMMKSRIGLVERRVKHPLVGKYIKRSTRIMFHDEKNEACTGDRVVVRACRPLSAHKSYVLQSITHKASS